MKANSGIPADISEEPLALQGLPVEFNRFLVLLDSLLPKSTQKDDPLAAIMLNSLNEKHFSDVNQEVIDNIKFLMDVCTAFRAQQYSKNPTNKFKDTDNIWLPMVLFGSSWNDAVSDLLSVQLPSQLHSIDMISLAPGSSKTKGSFTVELHPVLPNMDSYKYDQFKSYVKELFRLSTTYSVETEELELIGNRLLISENSDDAQYLLMGKASIWLEYLLENHYIKKLEITYPIRPSVALSTQSIISSIVIVPEFPGRWRDVPVLDQLAEIESLLGVRSDAPYYMSLLTPSPEYYPIIESYIKRLLRQSSKLIIVANEETNQNIKDVLLARYISFPPNADLRPDSGYENMEIYFEKTDSEDLLQPNQNLIIPVGHFQNAILLKIGNLNYLHNCVNIMQSVLNDCRQKMEFIYQSECSQVQTAQYKIFNKKGDSEEIKRIHATSSLNWATLSIRLIEKNLNMLNTFLRNTRTSDANMYNQKLAFLTDIDNKPKNSFDLIYQSIFKNALLSPDLNSRIECFAAILYLFDSKDIIEDSLEDIGYLDDYLIAAKLIETSKEMSSLTELREIASGFLDTIDAKIDRKLQNIIQDKYLDWSQWLKKLCS
jgi:uncharacterized membrane protein YkvA (DUF1232 family)